MLKINAEPGFFTEVFTELKSCGQLLNSANSSTSCGAAWRTIGPNIILKFSLSAQHHSHNEKQIYLS